MGALSYDEKRRDWIDSGLYDMFPKSTSSSSDMSTVSTSRTDRAADWWCSMHSRDPSGKRLITHPDTLAVAEQVVDLRRREVEGEITPSPREDALSRVLGRDHYGRMVGVGGVRVGVKKALGEEYSHTPRTRRYTPGNIDVDAMKEELRDQLKEELREEFDQKMKAMFSSFVQSMHASGSQLGCMDQSSVIAVPGGNPTSPPIPNLDEETPCELLVPQDGDEYGTSVILVADGHAQPQRDGQTVHGQPLPYGHYVVSIDTVRDGHALRPLPVQRADEGLIVLHDARGSFVAWPWKYVRFPKEIMQKALKGKGIEKSSILPKQALSPSKNPLLSSRSSKGSTPLKNDKKWDLLPLDVLQSLSQACDSLATCVSNMPDDGLVEVVIDKSVFRYPSDGTTWLYKVDLKELLAGEMLCISIIQIFMRAVFDGLLGATATEKVAFLCPQMIRGQACVTDPAEVKEYVTRVISSSMSNRDKFIIAPCYESEHWVLLVICPSQHVVFQFDSLYRVGEPRVLAFATILNSTMKKLSNKPRPVVPKWKHVKCARQQGGVECGYYMMRFMYDILRGCKTARDLLEMSNTMREEPFTQHEINEVRDKLAAYITADCF